MLELAVDVFPQRARPPTTRFLTHLSDTSKRPSALQVDTPTSWPPKCLEVNPDEIVVCSSTPYLIETVAGATTERRRRQRINVHWAVRLWTPDGRAVDTRTVNLSCDGFSCICREPFSKGDNIVSLLQAPKFCSAAPGSVLTLRCQAVVIRAEDVSDDTSRLVAFQILSYSVLVVHEH